MGHKTYTYTVLLEADPESGQFAVSVPALPGCLTHGDSIEQALERARDAIGAWLHDDTPRPEPEGLRALVATVSDDVDVVDGVVRVPGIEERVASASTG